MQNRVDNFHLMRYSFSEPL